MTLPQSTLRRLQSETNQIVASADPKQEACDSYSTARRAKWFEPVLAALKRMAGAGERCMFCSGSEASDLEHYRPKSKFPAEAMRWENFLWACTACNRAKRDRFPPDTEAGGRIINPVEDDPWAFLFIDEFGLLTAAFDPGRGTFDERGLSTIRVLKLNREALTDSRKSRLDDLKELAIELLLAYKANQIDVGEIERKLKACKKQPFQSDVADFFLVGPGRKESPFKDLFDATGAHSG